MKWNSSPHPISDIRQWNKNELLEIRPDYQRQEVWTPAARVMLIDTILKNIPMPKIYFQSIIKDEDTYRIVIDGQQRISTILSFLRDEFNLVPPYKGEFKKKKFSTLPDKIQKNILRYKIDINEITDATDEEVREIYSRVNKYTFALNKQELRRADYPGDFLNAAEDLALIPFFESSGVFTVANRRRMQDVEFLSEILSGLLAGAQDKKKSLDDFYMSYSKWKPASKRVTLKGFKEVISDVEAIFNPEFPIGKSRFRQKADFYSFFLAVAELRKGKYSLKAKDLTSLREDLVALDQSIEPESQIHDFSEYAIKCLSQGNTVTSRRYRQTFLNAFLSGTYKKKKPDEYGIDLFRRIRSDSLSGGGMCPDKIPECPNCQLEINEDVMDNKQVYFGWPKGTEYFQMNNADFYHAKCAPKDGQ